MNKRALLASAAVAVVGLSLLFAYERRLRQQVAGGPPVDLLVLRRDVGAGERIGEEMLIVRPLPEAYIEDRHVLADDLPKVIGVPVATELVANQALLWTDLTLRSSELATLSSRIPRGMRAMTVPANEATTFGGLLRPGDRVDVLLTRPTREAPSREVTVILLQNVLVLSVGTSFRRDAEALRLRRDGVSLLLTVEQAGLLAHAQREGVLRLVLRNENDLETTENLPPTDDSDVLKHEKRNRRQERFQLERVN